MMTAREFRDRMAALMATIHHDSQCYVQVSVYPSADHAVHKDAPIRVTLYPRGMGSHTDEMLITAPAETFEEAFADMAAKWSAHQEVFHARTVKRMALAIIRHQDAHGECTEAHLRTDPIMSHERIGFTQAEIDRYRVEACAEANKIAGKGPFTIKSTAKPNGAPND
jgi:hypothetical protein